MKNIFRIIGIFFIVYLLNCGQSQKSIKDRPRPLKLTQEQASKLAELPFTCIQKEYPNKLGQTLGSSKDIAEPHILHPAFYGCFDWHSAVHGHWSLIKLLKEYPKLDKAKTLKQILRQNLSGSNIQTEVKYFEGVHNKSCERTYGWAWVLYGLARQYPEYQHLIYIANYHVKYSLPNLISDSYEGGHSLGSFAIYALCNEKGNY